jgi:ferredoxin
MRVIIDQGICSGCGVCIETCPEVFDWEGDKATVSKDPVPRELENACQNAADLCPVEAIIID